MSAVRDRALAMCTRWGIRLISGLPDAAKRLMLGGRTITVDGNTLDPSIQLMLAGLRVMGRGGGLVVDGDALATRASNRALVAALNQPDIRVEEIGQVSIPGPAGVIPARHYRPASDGRTAPLLVFYHGGGWVFGDLESHDLACRLIAREAGVHVLAVDYRLAPEHPAPAAVDDANAAYRWARDHAVQLGADPDRVAVGGDSAGGNLAAVVTRMARDAGGPLPVLQWLVYPVTVVRGATRSRSLLAERFLLTSHDIDWFGDTYLAGSGLDASDPRVSPLLADDLTGLSPALVITAGFDPLRDEGEQYADALRVAGVPVDHRQMSSMTHAFINLNALGGGVSRANADMLEALRAHLAHG